MIVVLVILFLCSDQNGWAGIAALLVAALKQGVADAIAAKVKEALTGLGESRRVREA